MIIPAGRAVRGRESGNFGVTDGGHARLTAAVHGQQLQHYNIPRLESERQKEYVRQNERAL